MTVVAVDQQAMRACREMHDRVGGVAIDAYR
jgi:hypothetical protein